LNISKPGGTIPKLPYVGSGISRLPFPYGIRRVRVTSSDPIAKVMLGLGYPVYPENNSHGPTVTQFNDMTKEQQLAALNNAHTWVIEFPLKTNTKIRNSDERAVKQLYRYFDMQKYWTDHNTSITITFTPEEIPIIIDTLLDEWNNYVAISFLPKFDNDNSPYPLMPEQATTKEEYERRVSLLDHSPAMIYELLTELEREDMMTELLDSDCATGACPIR
jgi:ribonucleoside-triphosphate reductase